MTPQQQYHHDYYHRTKDRDRAQKRDTTKRWQQRNRTHLRAYARTYRQSWTPEYRNKVLAKHNASGFKRKYGITEADYNFMLQDQGGHCKLCPRTPMQERYKRLNVDHVHGTKIVRGLLCTPCNHALGALGDNAEGLARALAYVQ